ncbi:MAG: Metallophosphatase [Acidobacteria bacterium]|nr:Metallophosphatase [Acidobacteriota bacterium]
MRTIVHLSDIHFGRVDARVVAPLLSTVRSLIPDLVAISGDLTQRARRRQYEQARAFIAQLAFPHLVVPGNHDVPLYNLPVRFLDPLRSYRRYITSDLEPVHDDGEMIAVGMNSARSLPFHGGGRLNDTQVARASARLRAAPPDAVKIVVTHHPFDLPAGHGDEHLIGRSNMAMQQLAAAGADVFLAGHLHVSHVGHSAERYQIAGHSALVVQAGTLSTRERGEANTFNVLRLERPRIIVERYSWNDTSATFARSWTGTFQHRSDGWF